MRKKYPIRKYIQHENMQLKCSPKLGNYALQKDDLSRIRTFSITPEIREQIVTFIGTGNVRG